jgi:hypothetical protein
MTLVAYFILNFNHFSSSLVTKSVDALQNPYLIFENVARVKRYVDSVAYMGPIVVGSDCTKVRKRLNFSTQHGSHVLGTILDLADVEVDNAEDLDEIVERTVKEKAHATQARAIIAKVDVFFGLVLPVFTSGRPSDSPSRLPSSRDLAPADKWYGERFGYPYPANEIASHGRPAEIAAGVMRC